MNLFLGVFLFISSASAMSTDECATLYASRQNPEMAADCFMRTANFNRAFVTLALPDEEKAIDQAFLLLDQTSSAFQQTGDYAYWKAVFLSLRAQRLDRGRMIPRQTLKVLSEIKALLSTAIEKNPAVHQYGPARVLGIMHTEMPRIAGGNKSYAEELLAEAYQKGPRLSANHIAYAKILFKRGKSQEAEKVLTAFLKMSDADLNPEPSEPLMLPKAEIDADRKEAKELL